MSIVHKKPVENGIAKVPVVMQMEAVECGAASLTMVLAYFGKWVPLEEVREACAVSKDGSSAQNVIGAAINYGLDAEGYKCEPDQLKADGSFPCMIHWNFNHFVVLCGFKNGKAYLNDPAMGTYTVSMEEFDESFTGIAVFFEPTDAFVPAGQPKNLMGFVKKKLKGCRAEIAFVVLTTVILSVIGLITPAFSRTFVDYILTDRDPTWFMPFIVGFSALCLLELVTAWIQSIYSYKLSGKLDAAGNTGFMWKVLHLPMSFFSQRMAGDIRVRQDANASIADTLVNTLAPLVINAIMLVFYLAVMLKNSLLLTLIGVGSVFINTALSVYISRRRVNSTRVQMRDAGKLESTTVSAFDMIETLKASGAENSYFEKWSGYQASVYDQQYKYSRDNLFLESFPTLIAGLADILVMVVGVYLIICGQFTLGAVMAFQGFLNQFMQPVESFLGATQTIIEMRTDMERIDDVMEYSSDDVFAPDAEGAFTEKLSGRIEIKNLTFGYSALKAPQIENFSLEIRPGMQVAFVGPSGCGKSTISKIVSGLYKPWSGEVLFDGKPLREIPKNVFTGSLSVVDQDIVVFEDSVSENIKLWDNSIENFEMILAARDARIHDVIVQRPGAYQSRMNENGSNFSGGECQRIEIARVLAQDPSIIILDEATSALDSQTEFDVMQAIRNRGITSIVIAHRLSTIRDSDLIVVLNKGRVVGQGTHDELLETNEYYRMLVVNE